jgi:hypothetical protein
MNVLLERVLEAAVGHHGGVITPDLGLQRVRLGPVGPAPYEPSQTAIKADE